MKTKVLHIALFSTLFASLGASQAHAIEVTCENDFGSCRVSNDDGFDSTFCDCGDGGGGIDSGGNDFEGLTEEELLAQCESELELCEQFGGETGGATTGPGCDSDTHGGATTGADPTDGYADTTDGYEDGGSEETGFGDDAGEDGGDDGEGSSDGGFDPTKLNCSVGAGQGGGALMLGFLGLLGFLRRRNRR